MRLLVIATLVVACKGQQGGLRVAVDPVSEADAQTFAQQLAAAAPNCDEATLAPLVDAEALAAKFAARSTQPDAKETARKLAASTVGARILCAWLKGVEHYKVLRVRMVGAEPRPILRRVIRSPAGATIVGYDELQLGTTRRDRTVRLVDALSYTQGMWLSQLLAGNVDATATSIDYIGELPAMREQVREARERWRSGSAADALAALDKLPTNVRGARGVLLMRARVAAGVSAEAYKQALDEVAQKLGDDPTVALMHADAAFARGDHVQALRWLIRLDREIGGDAYLAARQALAYLRLGELAKALEAANRAIELEPTLVEASEAKLDVLIAQQRWADAVAHLTQMETDHAVRFDETELAADPDTKALVETPEFKDWLAKRK